MARATRRGWWAALVAGLLLATACVPPAPPGPTAAKPTTQPAAAAPTAAPAAKPTEAPRPAAPSPTTAPAAKPTEPVAAAKPTTAPPTAAPAPAAKPAADPAVARGQEVYVQQCQVCHGEQGQGVVGPALIGPRASLAKFGPTARDLYDYVRSAMPQQAPGSLSAEQYVDVVAYLLAQNALLPAGTAVSEASLSSIRIER